MNRIPKSGLLTSHDGKRRCWWCAGIPEYEMYHDEEWGRPVGDDRLLFEKLTLEVFQSGLSWLTILKKRDNFKKAFSGFDIAKVARFTKRDVARLMKDEGIVRHKGKIEAAITNARKIRLLQKEFGSFAAFIWMFEPDDKELPRELNFEILTNMAKTTQSVALSRELKRRGFSYVGPTTMYALMQAAGIVNDHLDNCHVCTAIERERRQFKRPV